MTGAFGPVDPRVDAYIDKSQAFAKPILRYVRAVVHETCPDCEEKIKWSTVAFDYKGPMCGMAAFKQHATFGFWKSSLVFEKGDEHVTDPNGMAAMASVRSAGWRRPVSRNRRDRVRR